MNTHQKKEGNGTMRDVVEERQTLVNLEPDSASLVDEDDVTTRELEDSDDEEGSTTDILLGMVPSPPENYDDEEAEEMVRALALSSTTFAWDPQADASDQDALSDPAPTQDAESSEREYQMLLETLSCMELDMERQIIQRRIRELEVLVNAPVDTSHPLSDSSPRATKRHNPMDEDPTTNIYDDNFHSSIESLSSRTTLDEGWLGSRLSRTANRSMATSDSNPVPTTHNSP